MAFTSVQEGNIDLEDLFITDAQVVQRFTGDKLYGWGYNFWGGLGNAALFQTTPFQTNTLISTTGWTQLGVSHSTVHGIKSDGTLWGWGKNDTGQIGNNTSSGTAQTAPIQIGILTNWASLSTGSEGHTIVVKTDSTLWGIGQNGAGQLGDGTNTVRSSPVQVGSGLSNWVSANTGGSHSMAINSNNQLYTCGYNNLGQLGHGDGTHRNTFTQVGTLTNWRQAVGGYRFSTAIKTDGTIWAWGHNGYGQLGDGTSTDRNSPVQIGSLTDWKAVSSGWYHIIALKNDNTVWAWGQNTYGQLGDGTTTHRSSPIQIGSLTDWKQLSCGYGHTIALKNDSTVWAWGKNDAAELGIGNQTHQSSPIQVGTATTWKLISAGAQLTLAAKIGV